jgi:hypothetical protein
MYRSNKIISIVYMIEANSIVPLILKALDLSLKIIKDKK